MFFLMAILPLLAFAGGSGEIIYNDKIENNKRIVVYDESKDKEIETTVFDLMCAIVTAEVPARFEEEALKAQAVAAYTYTLNIIKNNLKTEKKIEGSKALFKINSRCTLYARSFEEAKKNWDIDFDENKRRIFESVRSVFGQTILDSEKQPIHAMFFSTSSGSTYNFAEAFPERSEENHPYLVRADSSVDKEVRNFKVVVPFPKDIFCENIKNKFDIELKGKPENWIEKIESNDLGLVRCVTIGGKKIEGRDFRFKFGLRSSNFIINFKGDVFEVITRGYGHGVGMSQNGANGLAKKGMNYKEILKHYYPGTYIENRSFPDLQGG
ncbi:MAG: SpoIID/LytB domain-containing protein [Oscillospiraceae bacterium]|nr:SpoIID/LytB domain-containing protein [Oscillospiraceae bacterium]